MNRLRAHRRVATWVAALAVLMAALAPALSHALGSRLGAGWVEICTIAGSKWVQPSDDGAPAVPEAPATAHALEHCPFCTLHTPAIGLPPPPAAVLPAIDAAHSVPLAFLAAPRTLHAWASAQPRAPPSHS